MLRTRWSPAALCRKLHFYRGCFVNPDLRIFSQNCWLEMATLFCTCTEGTLFLLRIPIFYFSLSLGRLIRVFSVLGKYQLESQKIDHPVSVSVLLRFPMQIGLQRDHKALECSGFLLSLSLKRTKTERSFSLLSRSQNNLPIFEQVPIGYGASWSFYRFVGLRKKKNAQKPVLLWLVFSRISRVETCRPFF